MTLSSDVTKVSYFGNGSTTPFAVPFIWWDDTDLRVLLRDAAGVETEWVQGTDYTLVGGNGASGTLTATVAPATGTTLVIKSNRAETQLDDFPLGGPLSSATLEQAIDKTVRLVQQNSEGIGRSLQVAETDPASTQIASVTARANKLLGFDAGGNFSYTSILTGTPTDISGSTVQTTIGTVASTVADRFGDLPNLKRDFGAVGDGVADDTAKVVAAHNALSENDTLFVPDGLYRCTSTVNWTKAINIIGVGPASAFYLDVGAANDGFVVGTDAALIEGMFWHEIGFLGKTCRDVLVLKHVTKSDLGRVFAGTDEAFGTIGRYCFHTIGSLVNRYAFLCPGNNMPVNTVLGTKAYHNAGNGVVYVAPIADSALGIGQNANRFYVHLLGIKAYNAATEAVFYQAAQSPTGGNSVIQGAIEGLTAQTNAVPFRLDQCAKFRVESLHIEGFSQQSKLVGTVETTIVGSRLEAGLDIDSTTLSPVIDGNEIVGYLTIAANALHSGAQVGRNLFNGAFNIRDKSGQVVGTGPNRFSSGTGGVSQAPATPGGMIWGGGLDRWRATGFPEGVAVVGAGVTLTKTGLGQADTTRFHSEFAAKVTTTNASTGIKFVAEFEPTDGHRRIKGEWITALVKVKIPSGSTTTTVWLAPTYAPSGAILAPFNSTTTVRVNTKDEDTWLYATVKAENGADTFVGFQLLAVEAGDFYFGDPAVYVGVAPAFGSHVPPRVLADVVTIDGQRIGFASAPPTTGDWIQNDILINNASAVGQPLGWVCTVSGVPGTWVALPLVGGSNSGTITTGVSVSGNSSPTHGLGRTPAKDEVSLTPVSDPGPMRFWVSATSATTITIDWAANDSVDRSIGWSI